MHALDKGDINENANDPGEIVEDKIDENAQIGIASYVQNGIDENAKNEGELPILVKDHLLLVEADKFSFDKLADDTRNLLGTQTVHVLVGKIVEAIMVIDEKRDARATTWKPRTNLMTVATIASTAN